MLIRYPWSQMVPHTAVCLCGLIGGIGVVYCLRGVYPLVVTGMCTAMRRGDCCTLLRSSVDLEGGFVTVKTAKTGETVQTPIFPLLRSVPEKALAKPAPRPPFCKTPSPPTCVYAGKNDEE